MLRQLPLGVETIATGCWKNYNLVLRQLHRRSQGEFRAILVKLCPSPWENLFYKNKWGPPSYLLPHPDKKSWRWVLRQLPLGVGKIDTGCWDNCPWVLGQLQLNVGTNATECWDNCNRVCWDNYNWGWWDICHWVSRQLPLGVESIATGCWVNCHWMLSQLPLGVETSTTGIWDKRNWMLRHCNSVLIINWQLILQFCELLNIEGIFIIN
jgi:hypothetical protein